MTLEIQLSGTISTDGKVISLSDNTPVDNIVNSVNYWNGVTTRNNLNVSKSTTNATKPDKIDITDILITIPNKTVVTLSYSSGSNWIPVNTSILAIDSTTLSLTTSGQNVLSDGIYEFNYYIWSTLSTLGNYSISTGSTIVTCSSSQLAAKYTAGTFIRIDGVPYQVLQGLSSTTFQLIKPYTGLSNIVAQTPYIGSTIQYMFLNTYNAECCEQKLIATADTCCSDCENDSIMLSMRLYTLIRGARAQYASGMYIDAQKTIDLVNRLCNNSDCGCGCG